MRIDQMRQLLEIAKNKSLNIACQNLHISQQALSVSVKKMEEELETQLLYRTTQGVSLTEDGRYFAEGFNKILMEYDRMIKNHKKDVPEVHKEFSIAASFGCIESFLADVLSGYLSLEQVCDVHVKEGAYSVILQELLDEKSEMLVVNYSNFNSEGNIGSEQFFTSKDIVEIPLFTSPLYVRVSEKSSLAEMNRISLEELSKETILIYNDKNWLLNYMADTCAELGIDLQYRLEDNYQMHANLVRNGLGVAFGIMEGKFYQYARGIKYVMLDAPVEVKGVAILKAGKPIKPEVQHFINFLQMKCNQ